MSIFFLEQSVKIYKGSMFYKKYKFPLQVFVVFEKLPCLMYSSNVLTSNHYLIYNSLQWYYPINLFLKKDLFFYFSTLIESSAWDSLNYVAFDDKINFFYKNNRLMLYNNYYNYTNKLRLTFLYSYSLLKHNELLSIDRLYENSQWLERETSEMFNINYIFKKDTRSLLLDYPKKNFPLLKDFPTESWSELYYDFLEKTLIYTDTIDHIEL